MAEIKIIIVDDHKFYRTAMKQMLGSIDDCCVISEASNGAEFLELYAKQQADIVFMDIKMPVMDGIEATKTAVEEFKNIRIIALTMFEEKEYFLKMMYHGAKAFILKDAEKEEFEKAIRKVMQGKHYYPSSLKDKLNL